jgi:hypothetical protein
VGDDGCVPLVACGVGVVSSIIPIFRGSGFDAETTQRLGNAYDIACRSLHVKGQPPVIQESLAKKIIEAAPAFARPAALAASGHANVAPPRADMNCRLPMPNVIRPPKWPCSLQSEEGYHASMQRSLTQKRTSLRPARLLLFQQVANFCEQFYFWCRPRGRRRRFLLFQFVYAPDR